MSESSCRVHKNPLANKYTPMPCTTATTVAHAALGFMLFVYNQFVGGSALRASLQKRDLNAKLGALAFGMERVAPFAAAEPPSYRKTAAFFVATLAVVALCAHAVMVCTRGLCSLAD